jgi:hypothetical protein
MHVYFHLVPWANTSIMPILARNQDDLRILDFATSEKIILDC